MHHYRDQQQREVDVVTLPFGDRLAAVPVSGLWG